MSVMHYCRTFPIGWNTLYLIFWIIIKFEREVKCKIFKKTNGLLIYKGWGSSNFYLISEIMIFWSEDRASKNIIVIIAINCFYGLYVILKWLKHVNFRFCNSPSHLELTILLSENKNNLVIKIRQVASTLNPDKEIKLCVIWMVPVTGL